MTNEMTLLCVSAATIGVLHTLLGPDHYLPFVAMSRAGRWPFRKALILTMLCGVGHVLSSTLLGLVGIVAGIALFRLEAIENARGELAGWLLLAFGLLYFIYGIRRAARNRPHAHWHAHADGTTHVHEHVHADEHVHVHDARRSSPVAILAQRHGQDAPSLTPWILFTVFIFGPCEPLIPFLMYAASRGHVSDVAIVTLVFGLATLATMAAAVAFLYLAIGAVTWVRLERYSHALAGLVVLLCGAAIQAGL